VLRQWPCVVVLLAPKTNVPLPCGPCELATAGRLHCRPVCTPGPCSQARPGGTARVRHHHLLVSGGGGGHARTPKIRAPFHGRPPAARHSCGRESVCEIWSARWWGVPAAANKPRLPAGRGGARFACHVIALVGLVVLMMRPVVGASVVVERGARLARIFLHPVLVTGCRKAASVVWAMPKDVNREDTKSRQVVPRRPACGQIGRMPGCGLPCRACRAETSPVS
jgi:hypothetical protein